MKKYSSFLVRVMVLTGCVLILTLSLSELMRPKFYNDNYWPLDVTYQGFYSQKRDSVDVIFLGSSHAISAFSPQELYDSCGIRSFNLSREEQSLVISYYWLKEALRFQKPSAVVIDTAVCFPYTETPYNCNEPSIRKALDPMRWSEVKLEAVNTIHAMDSKESLASYVFPIIRYHGRWNDLSLNDIHFWPKQRTDLRGYSILSEDCGIKDFVPLSDTSASAAPAELHGVMRQYLSRMHSICDKNGIQLLLVSTPYIETSPERHEALKNYAQEEGLNFLDFNEAEWFETMDFQFDKDMADGGHANCFGAAKLTDAIGKVLLAMGVEPKEDPAYESTRAYVDRQTANANLYRLETIGEYLAAFERDRYLIFAEGSGACGKMLEAAGLRQTDDGGFTAVYDGKWTGDPQKLSGSDFALNVSWKLQCQGNSGKITVYGKDYERKHPGVEIVLLDREKGYVMDHSCFDESGKRISETD